jgi:RNA-binding protein
MPLTTTQKRYLRGLAHDLDPVVMVGQKGITPAVVAELDGALAHHELVKLKLPGGDRAERADAIEALASATSAEPVQAIGRTATLYRRHPKQPRIVLPR